MSETAQDSMDAGYNMDMEAGGHITEGVVHEKTRLAKLLARLRRNRVLLSVISATFILANLIIFVVDGPFPTNPHDHQLVTACSDEQLYHIADIDDAYTAQVLVEDNLVERVDIPPPIRMARPVRQGGFRIQWHTVKRVFILAPFAVSAILILALIDFRVVAVWAEMGWQWSVVRLQSNWEVFKVWMYSLAKYFEMDLAYHKLRRMLEAWGYIEKAQ